jgi:hypothetical protein
MCESAQYSFADIQNKKQKTILCWSPFIAWYILVLCFLGPGPRILKLMISIDSLALWLLETLRFSLYIVFSVLLWTATRLLEEFGYDRHRLLRAAEPPPRSSRL